MARAVVRGEEAITGAVGAVVHAAVAAARRAGRVSAGVVAEAIEAPGRALTRRVVDAAVAQPRPVPGRQELARALADLPSTPVVGSAAAAALAARVARRFGPLRFLTRRTPLWLLAAAVPALHASVSRGAGELGLVASHLVLRARAAGIEPNPERVRRAAVQLLAGAPVDPDRDPSHRPLVTGWLFRALRAALPLASGVTTRDSQGLATAAEAVPPGSLQ